MPSDNQGEWPLEIIVHSNDDFITFARSLGYSEETIHGLPFQSINSTGLPPSSPYNKDAERLVQLHVPMWRWEVDKEEWEGKYPVTFLWWTIKKTRFSTAFKGSTTATTLSFKRRIEQCGNRWKYAESFYWQSRQQFEKSVIVGYERFGCGRQDDVPQIIIVSPFRRSRLPRISNRNTKNVGNYGVHAQSYNTNIHEAI
jgi:hypothetical protein